MITQVLKSSVAAEDLLSIPLTSIIALSLANRIGCKSRIRIPLESYIHAIVLTAVELDFAYPPIAHTVRCLHSFGKQNREFGDILLSMWSIRPIMYFHQIARAGTSSFRARGKRGLHIRLLIFWFSGMLFAC